MEIHGITPVCGQQDEQVKTYTGSVLVMDSRGTYETQALYMDFVTPEPDTNWLWPSSRP